MNNIPRVSIGMPVYNGIPFLKETLDSILAQTFHDFELIISDNASTDETEEICRAYAAKEKRIRYYRQQENQGAAWNHNHVVELATGEYFKWQSHDDLCHPQFVEKCVRILDRDPSVVLCYSKFLRIDEHGRPFQKLSSKINGGASLAERFRSVLHRGTCEEIFGVMRRNVLRQTQMLGKYSNSDDNCLAELSLHGSFYEVPEELFLHRIHPRMSTSAYPNKLDRIEWFDPLAKGRITFPLCRQLREYVLLIRRSALPRAIRLHCYLAICGWFWTSRRHLLSDFKALTVRYAPWTRSIWRVLKKVMGLSEKGLTQVSPRTGSRSKLE
jgi:glycosyltransferase involved in cell wall biosynthesis